MRSQNVESCIAWKLLHLCYSLYVHHTRERMNDNFLWCGGSNIYFGYHILLLIVSGLLYPQLRCIKYSACFVFCLFYFNRQQVIWKCWYCKIKSCSVGNTSCSNSTGYNS